MYKDVCLNVLERHPKISNREQRNKTNKHQPTLTLPIEEMKQSRQNHKSSVKWKKLARKHNEMRPIKARRVSIKI
jgi:hypothetical protein